MPLRAKITSPAMRTFASQTDSIRELPDDEPNDVLFNSMYGVRTIELNRPKKLNSLNGSMARKIVPRLQEWENSQMANAVIIKGAGRAFCAGGDVAALALDNKKGAEGQQASKDYFALEYKLDHLIATYSKPYIAFLDGITMGGGVGLSVHAPIRIATENTVFAMPETTIGFFPDVGASFFLPRMDGELGMYLALTSEQLKGVNVFYSGIATHYLDSSSLPDLEARLAELQFKDYDPLSKRLEIINSTIEEFCTGLPHDQPLSAPVGGTIRTAIDYVFQPAFDITEILKALDGLANMNPKERGGDVLPGWAKKTRETILGRSPTSVRVAMQQLRKGRSWDIAETFRREHAIASKFMEHADFIEGVSALLINKPRTKPVWQPETIEEVSDETVQSFFEEKQGPETLQLLRKGEAANYKEYPHAWLGLPQEREVAAVVGRKGQSRESIVNHFVQKSDGKMGVREKVQDILERKTRVEAAGLAWQR